MSLRLTLKKNERVVVGRAVVTNGNKNITLIIENTVPILREKDIMQEKDAQNPYKRVYFTIQLMYLDESNLPKYLASLAKLVNDISLAAPSTTPIIEEINTRIGAGQYYKALKTARILIDYEEAHQKNSM